MSITSEKKENTNKRKFVPPLKKKDGEEREAKYEIKTIINTIKGKRKLGVKVEKLQRLWKIYFPMGNFSNLYFLFSF